MNALFRLLAKERIPVPGLERIYASYRHSPTFVDDALSTMLQLEPEAAHRAAWLLYRHARESLIDDTMAKRIAEAAEEMDHWIARLNLCQLFSAVGCPKEARESAFPFLVRCAEDRRVLVRAWAVSALATFRNDPEYRSEIGIIMARAKRDRSKAMQARLRNLATPTRTHLT